jgi:hypothetical protein
VSESTSLRDLVEQFMTVRNRTVFARHGVAGTEQPADYWAELQLGAEIAREVQAGRWVVVACLLRLGAVESWGEVGKALDMFENEARDGFRDWISNQRWLNRHYRDTVGLTEAEAEELTGLATAVAR